MVGGKGGDQQIVTALELAGNGLEGAWPTCLERLPNLYTLELSRNNLQGVLGPEVGDMAKVRTWLLCGALADSTRSRASVIHRRGF